MIGEIGTQLRIGVRSPHFLPQEQWSLSIFYNPQSQFVKLRANNGEPLLSINSTAQPRSTSIMSISSSISTICTPFICRNFPHFKPTPEILTRISHCHGGRRTLQFELNTSKTFCKRFAFSGRKLRFCVRAGESNGNEEELEQLRGKSTMPDRFRYLTKEVPSPPLRWPWFVGKISMYLYLFLFFPLMF